MSRSKYLFVSFVLLSTRRSSLTTGCLGSVGLALSNSLAKLSSQNCNLINAILCSETTEGILASSTLKALIAKASRLASPPINNVQRKFS